MLSQAVKRMLSRNGLLGSGHTVLYLGLRFWGPTARSPCAECFRFSVATLPPRTEAGARPFGQSSPASSRQGVWRCVQESAQATKAWALKAGTYSPRG